jgi:hypothetical protein
MSPQWQVELAGFTGRRKVDGFLDLFFNLRNTCDTENHLFKLPVTKIFNSYITIVVSSEFININILSSPMITLTVISGQQELNLTTSPDLIFSTNSFIIIKKT